MLAELAEAKLLRAVYSERQLEEVLVDFWFNHFNVFARKGPDRDLHRRVRARGDSAACARALPRSARGDGEEPGDALLSRQLAERRSERGTATPIRRAGRTAARNGSPRRRRHRDRPRRGLNENYARELLELHTLGVDGGYTQQDVVDVARAFTGWTIGRPGEDAGFRFASRHARPRRQRSCSARRSPPGGGIEDGERVLDILAAHPSTARHIALKLAQRFVSDTPPPALVDRAAAAFRQTDGDLREVVRTIVTSPEFFAPMSVPREGEDAVRIRGQRAARDAGGDSARLRRWSARWPTLGMPLYLCQPPTGYDETAEAWVSSGALVNRMNFAVALASGELRGVRLPAPRVDTGRRARTHHPRCARRRRLGRRLTRHDCESADSAAQTIALAIGSPEFQRQ